MDISEHLIFISGKDQTDHIKSFEALDNDYLVFLNDGTEKRIPKNYLIYYNNPKIIEGKDVKFTYKGSSHFGIHKIYEFEKYLRVVYENGHKMVYKKEGTELTHSSLVKDEVKNIIQYFKNLTPFIKSNDDDAFLHNQYEKVNFISPKSIAAYYCSPDSMPKKPWIHLQTVFPFGMNLSQIKAVDQSFQSHVSIINGPPGTGKTQTILNIIANVLLQKKTVAIVSNNNSATDNVLEKLIKEDLGFLAAPLGNTKNVEKFLANQPNYPDLENWQIIREQKQHIRQQILSEKKLISKAFKSERKLAELRQELKDLKLQKEHYFKLYSTLYNNDVYYYSYKQHKPLLLRELSLYFKKYGHRNRLPGLFGKIKIFLKYGIYGSKFYKHSLVNIIDSFKKKYFSEAVEQLEYEVFTLETELADLNQKLTSHRKLTMSYFKAEVAERFIKDKRPIFYNEDLWKSANFKDFIQEYPIVLSTTHSLKRCIANDFSFDYLIIDEASQVGLVSGFLPLICANNLIVVGDIHQLPNIVNEEEKTENIFSESNLPEYYNYTKHCLLSSIDGLFGEVPKTTLREHYRCPPSIINFSNQQIYGGELIIMTQEKQGNSPLRLHYTAKGNHARRAGVSKNNQREIDAVENEIIMEVNSKDECIDTVFISPYRGQTNLASEKLDKIESDTVHKFQGRENRQVIFSTVANVTNTFINDPKLLNVALTRAEEQFVLVTSEKIAESSVGILGDLITYIRYHNMEVSKSQVRSIFDKLYDFDQMIEGVQNEITEGEKQMQHLLNKVFLLEKFGHLSYKMHVDLRDFVPDDLLTPEEREFVHHPNSHVDFAVYSRSHKKPLLVIEVDGYRYHSQDPEQIERDNKKDLIMEKYSTPILRFATNGSNEEEILLNTLNVIISGKYYKI